ncbi:MAG: restriction endonuclease [Rhodanobacteraceae bacterium]|nr:restriction endonuclease [Rhodanobacteraceae bacterium]HQW81004.1 restriction endonuclease [Pseudomonadota bacterium]
MAKSKDKSGAEFVQWMPPLLDALRALGGEAKPREVCDWIAGHLNVPTSKLDETTSNKQLRFNNQVAWARQYLVWEGLLDGSRRGIWVLTATGWKHQLSAEQARELFLRWVKIHAETRRQSAEVGEPKSSEETIVAVPDEEAFEDVLLATLRGLPARGFELACVQLLRRCGLESVEATQQSRDFGIDGFGTLRLNPVVTVRVAFQAKRYKDVVGREVVAQFRNDISGIAEKGVIITTGRFTKDARTEATKPGRDPIELIDGEQLVTLFVEKELGVKPRTVHDVDGEFFARFRGN